MRQNSPSSGAVKAKLTYMMDSLIKKKVQIFESKGRIETSNQISDTSYSLDQLLNRSAVDKACHKLGGLVSFVEGKSFNSLNLLI